jgi:sugar (pentulose or hexulose) kinase
MSAELSFLAVDLGAASGRVMNCGWNGSVFSLQEVHRFPNGGVRFGAGLHWDVLRIWSEIQSGLTKFNTLSGQGPAGIGVDAWGVDFALLDARDRLIGNPYHYRDARTHGIPAALSKALNAHDFFRATGVQTMEINTAFQLTSMALASDPQLHHAHTLLMIPDIFQFLLCGKKRAEYTEASTTELFDLRTRRWPREILEKLELPPRIFPEVVLPGTILAPLLPALQSECGFSLSVPCIAVASHDTSSAVAAIPDLDESSVFLSSGTWSLMGVALDQPNFSDEAFHGGFTNEGAADGTSLLIKNMTGLWIVQECARTWSAAGNPIAWAELEQAASQAAAFRSFIDPADTAFQSPADMCAAIALYCSQTGQAVPQTPGEFARCVFESLSFVYRDVIEDLERVTGRALNVIRVVGGGSLNKFLCQMTADACEREVVAGPVEAAALGNAMVQAVATGHLANLAQGREALRKSVEYRSYAPTQSGAWQQAFSHYKSIVARGRTPEPAPAHA